MLYVICCYVQKCVKLFFVQQSLQYSSLIYNYFFININKFLSHINSQNWSKNLGVL